MKLQKELQQSRESLSLKEKELSSKNVRIIEEFLSLFFDKNEKKVEVFFLRKKGGSRFFFQTKNWCGLHKKPEFV